MCKPIDVDKLLKSILNNKHITHITRITHISGVIPIGTFISGVRRRTAEYLQIADNFATKHQSQQQHNKPIIMSREQVRAFRVLSVKDRVLIVQSPKRYVL